jgi:hypothetical protein
VVADGRSYIVQTHTISGKVIIPYGEGTMDIHQELIEVYHLLRHQEERLYEIHKSLRALTEVLQKYGVGPEYAKSFEAIGSSAVALDYAGKLRLIDETIQSLQDDVGR